MKLKKWHPKAKKGSAPRYRVRPAVILVLVLTLFEAVVVLWNNHVPAPDFTGATPAIPTQSRPAPGNVVAVDSVEQFDSAKTTVVIHHNFPAGVPNEASPVTKVTFQYQSQLPGGEFVTEYGRAYLPTGDSSNLPTLAFAPGTTGIGDQCAPSLENPATGAWGGYDSHLSAYAVQGYAVVTTDYEGLRDPSRLHHYMVGELEGRALLDAVRALRRLPEAKNRLSSTNIFLSGYSQGGHAAFWADKIAARYAPDVRPLGVVGWGPVMSVEQTLTDITHGANINWFGPNVLVSYEDYYHQSYPGILLPRRQPSLVAEVVAHCIDTDLPYWGHTPVGLYTPEFIAAAGTGTLAAGFPEFAKVLAGNAVGDDPTPSAKRINQGARDNVVLPAQQTAALPLLCSSSVGPVGYYAYPNTTHYDAMQHSFSDTLAWMRTLAAGQTVPSTCR
ncbi:MAG TPA: lipase family protein [Candidatus Saccharimonadia bacterium]|nr:lipase family protein [Candidatus Saccharimonadia bacterium]